MADPSGPAVREPYSNAANSPEPSIDVRRAAWVRPGRLNHRTAQRSRRLSLLIGVTAVSLIAAAFYVGVR